MGGGDDWGVLQSGGVQAGHAQVLLETAGVVWAFTSHRRVQRGISGRVLGVVLWFILQGFFLILLDWISK